MNHITVVLENLDDKPRHPNDKSRSFIATFFSSGVKVALAWLYSSHFDPQVQDGPLDSFYSRVGDVIPFQQILNSYTQDERRSLTIGYGGRQSNFAEVPSIATLLDIMAKFESNPRLWYLDDTIVRLVGEIELGFSLEMGKRIVADSPITSLTTLDPWRSVKASLTESEVRRFLPLFEDSLNREVTFERFLNFAKPFSVEQTERTEFTDVLDLYWFQCIVGNVDHVRSDWGAFRETLGQAFRHFIWADPTRIMPSLKLSFVSKTTICNEISIRVDREQVTLSIDCNSEILGNLDELGWQDAEYRTSYEGFHTRVKQFDLAHEWKLDNPALALSNQEKNIAEELCTTFSALGLEPLDLILALKHGRR